MWETCVLPDLLSQLFRLFLSEFNSTRVFLPISSCKIFSASPDSNAKKLAAHTTKLAESNRGNSWNNQKEYKRGWKIKKGEIKLKKPHVSALHCIAKFVYHQHPHTLMCPRALYSPKRRCQQRECWNGKCQQEFAMCTFFPYIVLLLLPNSRVIQFSSTCAFGRVSRVSTL